MPPRTRLSNAQQAAADPRVKPTPASPRGRFIATVKENIRLCTDHYRLVLSLPRFPRSIPGQFVEVDCRDPRFAPSADHDPGPRAFDWPPPASFKGDSPVALPRPCPSDPDFNAPLAYLRRPFSLADHRVWPDGYTELDLIHRVVGRGTLLLAQLLPGQTVSLIGPLGNGFTLPTGIELACLVGGGVGVPPMLYMAKGLQQAWVKNVVGFIGAQREDLLPITLLPPPSAPEPSKTGDPLMNVAEFKEYGYPAVITTDDGSIGMKGYVTEALRSFLEERQVQQGKLTNTIVYCCGPTPMMKATARVAAAFGVQCQVSLEQPMACGMGTCQSCVIRYRPHTDPKDAPSPLPQTQPAPSDDWKYKLTCTDGPVFDTRDILW